MPLGYGLVLSEPSDLNSEHDQDGADESDRCANGEHVQSQSQVHHRPPRLNWPRVYPGALRAPNDKHTALQYRSGRSDIGSSI
jgi:hypothetical protein